MAKGRQKKEAAYSITWDKNKRIDFVTGFKKRKDERRVYAKEKIKEEVREVRLEHNAEKRKQRLVIE